MSEYILLSKHTVGKGPIALQITFNYNSQLINLLESLLQNLGFLILLKAVFENFYLVSNVPGEADGILKQMGYLDLC